MGDVQFQLRSWLPLPSFSPSPIKSAITFKRSWSGVVGLLLTLLFPSTHASAADQTFNISINQLVAENSPGSGAGRIENPGDTDTYVFTASAGQRLYFDERSGAGCSLKLRWRLTDPDGLELFNENFASVDQCGSGPDAGIHTLAKTGSYRIRVSGNGNNVDSYSFQVFSATPQQFALTLGQIVTNGIPSAGAGNIETPGATDTYTFTAAAGQAAYFDEMTGFGCNFGLRWRLLGPQGQQIFDQYFASVEQCGSGPDAGLITLTNAGTYSLTVYGVLDYVEPYSFRIVPVVPQQFAISLGQTITNGVPAAGAGNIETPGATDTYTFTAAAGQMAYFDEMTGFGCNFGLRWRLLGPQGQQIFDQYFASVEQCGSGPDAGLITFTNAGTYSLTVYGVLDYVEPYSFRIVPVVPQQFAISLGQIVTNGVPAAGAGNIETPGATDTYTFTAAAGQMAYFDEMTGFGCNFRLRWRLVGPQGQQIFDEHFAAIDQCNSGSDAGLITFTNAGTYSLTVYGNLDNTDTYAFAIWNIQPPLVPSVSDRDLNEGASLRLTILGSPSSPIGYPLQFNLITGPAGAKLDALNGELRWTAPPGVFGENVFTVGVRDALGQEKPMSFRVRVAPAADLALSKLSAPLSGAGGAGFTLTSEERNVGSRPLVGDWEQTIWISTDPSLDAGDSLLASFHSSGPLAPGQIIARSSQIQWPEKPGVYYLIARTDSANALEEPNEANNEAQLGPITVGPSYAATVSTEINTALSGTPIPLRGSATRSDGSPARNADVAIEIRVRGTTRTLRVTTGADGQFTTVFRPLLGEAGNFTVGAGHPALDTFAVQDQFKLIGMTVSPRELPISLAANGTVLAELKLKNRSQETLHGLKATIEGLPAAAPLTLTVGQPPAGLSGDQEIVLAIQARSTSAAGFAGQAILRFTTLEGATAEVPLVLTVSPQASNLAVAPGSLSSSMQRGEQRVISFDIRNNGGSASGPVQILLPTVPWMSVANQLPLPSLPAGASTSVSLLLQPTASLPLGEHTGSLLVTDGTSAANLPYRFIATSDLLANLEIEVVDELTYYAQGSPKVAGAQVTLRRPGDLTAVTNQVTDAQGRVRFSQLTEGYYDVEIQAAKHGRYHGTTLIVAGDDNFIQPFLTYETVRYEFTVQPATIDDRSRITIETVFETTVPLPVITIEPNLIDLQEIQSDRTEIELHITNHGLVAAQDLQLRFASNEKWRFTPLQDVLGTLDARSSISVPLVIERLSPPAPVPGPALADGSSGGGDCGLGGQACWTLICGKSTRSYCSSIIVPADCGGGGGLYSQPFVTGIFGAGGGFSAPVCQCLPMPCDPCANNVTGVLLDYGISGVIPILAPVLGPPLICLKDGAKCYQDILTCSTNGSCSSQTVLIDCVGAAISCGAVVAVAAGAAEFGAGLAAAGFIAGLAGLGDGIANACKPTGAPAPVPSLASTDPTFFPGQAAVATETARLRRILEAYASLFGDSAWVHSKLGTNFAAFVTAFREASDLTSPGGQRLTSTERSQLLAMPRPELIQTATVEQFLDRWNRTVDYNQRGIVTLAALPSGENPDFLAADVLAAKFAAAALAIGELEAAGHANDLAGGFRAAVQALVRNLQENSGGICARVRLRLSQDAVTTREAFQASLELENNSGEPLTGLKVELQVFAQGGEDAASRFGVLAPELSGLNAVNGTGVVPPQSIGTAKWLVVPGHSASPSPDPVVYFVGGYFSYIQEGHTVRVPLSPAPITVHPTPRLQLTYFHERDVLSDDPFTDAIEPTIPYSLAVMAKNVGFGTANAVKIISGEPQIVENEKGLLIDFDLIGSEIDGSPQSTSLTADFGEIAPQQVKSGRWLFTSSLQGQFIDYTATFENVGPLSGLPELSTIESVSIHELTHIVRAEGPTVLDDGQADYLVNDVTDDDFLPDHLYLSNGTTNSVSVIREAQIDRTPTAQNLRVEATVAVDSSGWTYLRLLDPSQGQFNLVRVQRANGSDLRFGENVWTRDRTFIAGGRRPRYEHTVHLFDHVPVAGNTRYVLTYAPIGGSDTIPPSSGMIRLPETSRPQIPVQWFGGDNSGGSGIAFFDVFVAVDRGPYELWLGQTPLTGALYPGVDGHHYAFYTIATDRAHNVEAAPGVADTFTTVGLGNSRPTLDPIADQVLDEGSVLSLSAAAHDTDLPLDRLTFSLGEDAPPGLTIDAASGQLYWRTGEGNGPSTSIVSVRVHDSGSPALSDVRTFRITVKEVNSAPELAPLSDVILNEGDRLQFNLSAADPDLPKQALHFSLESNSPPSLSLNETTGEVRWQTTDLDGPSTNRIIVRVSDGALSVERAFSVVVRDTRGDFNLQLGEAFVVTGGSGAIPIRVESSIDLGELSFVLELPPGRLTDLNLVPQSSTLGNLSLRPLNGDRYEVRLTASAGQILAGDLELARLQFTATAGPNSTSITLRPRDLQGLRSNGQPLLAGTSENGLIVIVGNQPVLSVGAGTRKLRVHGHVGEIVRIESARSLDASEPWVFFRQLVLNATLTEVDLPDEPDRSRPLFLRAVNP